LPFLARTNKLTKLVGIVNPLQIANAGSDTTVKPYDLFTIDGSKSSDPDSSITSYLWKQMTGPTVNLYAANTRSVST
jgi:hypothetical protein